MIHGAGGDGVGEIASLLEHRHGLRFDGAGQRRLARAVEETARRAGTPPGALARRLATDAAAERDLLDRVTLQESSWFRDEATWTALRDVVLPAALARDPQLEIWSAGCAHGQEAWSLAMLLDELGAQRARVVASDVSGAAVARAAAGRYDERELRGLAPERRARHGHRVSGGWEVAPRLRGRVRFTRHNLATDPPPVAASRCGVVLCRYVLIYVATDAATRFLRQARATLGPDGVLVVGAAETLWHLTDEFAAEPLGQSFVYRPRSGPGAAPSPAPGRAGPRRPVAGARPPRTMPAAAGGDGATIPDPAFLLRRGDEALARGDHASAVSAFRGAAFLSPADPVPHLRLGLALEAQGDEGAGRAFRAARAALDLGGEGAGAAGSGDVERILDARLGPR